MRRVAALLALILIAVLPRPLAAQTSPPVEVAAAADLRFALDDLSSQFVKRTGVFVRVTYGSTGQFAAQIQQGAPFDIFFSADEDAIQQLVRQGLILRETAQLYGIGRIVLWVRKDSPIDPRQGLGVLTGDRIRFVAIANPEHAPYGRAAAQAIRAAGLWDQVQSKLVLGENISQTLQFVQTGNADAGILALALVVADPIAPTGRYWIIPSFLHNPIRQAAGVVARSPRPVAAKAFLAFVNGPEGRPIMRRYGFVLPGESP